jgi:hypothetical protein
MAQNPKNASRQALPSGLQGARYAGGYFGLFKEDRCKEAAERQAKRDARSPQEQLAVLDVKLGKGIGATRERAKLLAQIAEQRKSD